MCDCMKELMYEFMAPNAALTDLEDACRKTLSAGCAGICVPQWFVSAAKQSLGGAAKVATLVGLPGGRPQQRNTGQCGSVSLPRKSLRHQRRSAPRNRPQN